MFPISSNFNLVNEDQAAGNMINGLHHRLDNPICGNVMNDSLYGLMDGSFPKESFSIATTCGPASQDIFSNNASLQGPFY
jgi:hypothetical protein